MTTKGFGLSPEKGVVLGNTLLKKWTCLISLTPKWVQSELEIKKIKNEKIKHFLKNCNLTYSHSRSSGIADPVNHGSFPLWLHCSLLRFPFSSSFTSPKQPWNSLSPTLLHFVFFKLILFHSIIAQYLDPSIPFQTHIWHQNLFLYGDRWFGGNLVQLDSELKV